MNPITYLCGALDRLFERSPVAGIFVAMALAFVCMIAIAYLNQDGATVTTINARYA
ncbi:hypothetical protein [Burkholderia singularis]|uniref:Uncharacterized protein n=1 Tax=Burkholderia singularis TaxID=1503053 RepID=A0A238H8U4_9BURK|nr:hypothetical protein [Burkholderia singularis]SMG01704.1 hypothetical protein BSIN_5372 [Burkholderia singularis]